MKKTLLQNTKYIIFGLILAFAASVFAGTWTNPTTTAPGGNLAVPIHTGPTQVKGSGACTAGNCGGLSVGTFSVAKNAEFDQDVYFNGVVRGDTPADTASSVNFGDSTHVVNATINGNASVVGVLKSGGVANSSSASLCAGVDGAIKVCGAATAVKENYTVPAQSLVRPMPDYAYTSSGRKYIVTVCLSDTAQRALTFHVKYNEDTGTQRYATVNLSANQLCGYENNSDSTVVLSAPATKVGPATNKCVYEGADTTYQSPAYQGYAVSVDQSLRCN